MPRFSHPAGPVSLLAAALLATSACSDIIGGGPQVAVSLRVEAGVALPVVLEVDHDGQRVRLEATTAAATPRMDIVANRYGEAPVRLMLSAAGEAPLATVELTHSLHRGSTHWVSTLVGRQRPQGHCYGALGVVALAPRAGQTVPDTMFVMYGSLPRGAIC